MRRLTLVALVSLLAACSHGPAVVGPAPVAKGRKVVYVSLGGDETAGADLGFPAVVQDRWPQLVFHDGLPTRAVHVDLAARSQLIDDGAHQQLDLAVDTAPTLATVWFGPGDEDAGTPVSVFADDLSTIVDRLTAAHVRVLVATHTGTRYDTVIDRVVAAGHATPVSVAGLPAPLGITGHAQAATRFERAIGRVR